MKRVGIAVAWILLFVVVGLGVTLGLAAIVPAWGGFSWQLLRNTLYALIGFAAATYLVGRVLARESWDRLGWYTPLWPRLLRGIGIGGLMAVGAIALAVLLDSTSVTFTRDWSRWPSVAVPLGATLLLAALGEELMFRGFPLRRAADAIGRVPATLLLGIGFALAHLANPHVGPIGTVNIALAGIWLAAAFFSAGGMALAWGLHFGWNAGLALLFDAPVSGYLFRVPAVEYAPGAHTWVDGGRFGPEGGIVATVVLIAATVYLLRRGSRPPAPAPDEVAA